MCSLFFPRHDETLIAILWEAGTVGIVEEGAGLRAYFEDAGSLDVLTGLGGEFRNEPTEIAASNANDWPPIAVGQRLYLVPPSFSGSVPESRWKLQLQSGAAFGSGRHETTQLCLEAMERYMRPGAVVIDTGCGSGILSAAAHLLGASRVISCDIDPNAVDLTRRYMNKEVFSGSADAIAPHTADLVIANLTAAILDKLAWDLKRIARPQGLVLLSGFLRDRVPLRFRPHEEFERNEWLCWVCRSDAISAPPPGADGLVHDAEWWL
ncbi:MAG TPA: 50S ribosomal protein L11 methyltransferase [Bryobacteraceae bacterium]